MKIRILTIGALAAFQLVLGTAAMADDFTDSVRQNLKFREAERYSTNTGDRGVEVGIEQFGKGKQERLFGTKTDGYLTYDVAITNNSRYRLYFSDLRIVDEETGLEVVRPDLGDVLDKNKPRGFGNKDQWRMAMFRTNLLSKSLDHKIIEPGQTQQGVLFIHGKGLGEGGGKLHLRVQNLKRLAYLDFELPLAR